jgi:hypothetical protein
MTITPIEGKMEVSSDAVSWSDEILDQYVAPDLSRLKACTARDLPQIASARGHLMIWRAFHPTTTASARTALTLASNFVRHLDAAAVEYRSCVDHLRAYVAGLPKHRLSEHNVAVARLEGCILQLHVAMTCLKQIEVTQSKLSPLYVSGDGSDYDRLRLLNNRIKHFDEDLKDELTKPGGAGPSRVAPVWITDTHVVSSTASLSFDELAELIEHHLREAEQFVQRLWAGPPVTTST